MKKKALYFLFMIFALLSISFCISAEMLGGNKLIEWEGGHYREDIRMYTLTSIDYIKGEPEFDFISLSDDIDLYDNKYKKDIYLIPSAENKTYKKEQYLLTGSYRTKLLNLAGISEDDTVFIYDYLNNKLKSVPVYGLNTFAVVNTYYHPHEPYGLDAYMFGFKLNSNMFDQYASYIVYIGKENPFLQQPLTPLVWHQIDSKDFPVLESDDEITSLIPVYNPEDLIKGDNFMAEAIGLRFYIQNYETPDNNEIIIRHLIILDSDSNMITNVVHGYFEGGMLLPLSSSIDDNKEIFQWVGSILKNEPPVIFDFSSEAFSCRPLFQFIHPLHEYFIPRCDCRH
ncbi:hypothetical protein B6D19_11810 [Gilliamella apicola]|uniref:hypothetical protein n=1 Tax=Gilliamella apicola TaxID=1196095 RepID=UPI000A3479B1|nr:hypothetical protein [Gilliamella apicola]OTQ29841.1 hypothetical protein B6D19_11810 [Gilliamella apicola]OTQ39157.1 hypothetical protein B6D20_11195 [Gilliamella apicola]